MSKPRLIILGAIQLSGLNVFIFPRNPMSDHGKQEGANPPSGEFVD